MPHYICLTCGTQFPRSDRPPAGCPICLDYRQVIGWNGQQWTTLDQLRAAHRSLVRQVEPGLTGLGLEPGAAIGQRAQLVQTPEGNLLWGCLPLLDDAALQAICARGGLAATAISQPHFCSAMVEWSHAFGGVPIYLRAAERPWAMRHDLAIVFWDGETRPLFGGLTLIRCGVLHAGGILYVASDRRYVRFMYSYSNLIPLNAAAVRRIVHAIEPFPQRPRLQRLVRPHPDPRRPRRSPPLCRSVHKRHQVLSLLEVGSLLHAVKNATAFRRPPTSDF